MTKKTISIILVLALCVSFSTPAFAADSEQPSSWAVEQVNAAIAANLVPPSLQSDYTQAITRAEFCALAVALYVNVVGEIAGRRTFADTDDVNVEKMAAVGVVSGVGNNRFNPDDTLTREQAAVILSQLADAVGSPLTRHESTFTDSDGISLWAIESVGRVQAAGIMGGVGNNFFSPKSSYTREQSIVTILRLFDAVQPVVEIDLRFRDITNERLAEMIASGYIPANVARLDLGGNSISDLSLLSNLTSLTALDLWGNEISNVSPLRNLTSLTELDLWGNQFADISPLGNLANLEVFVLGGNPQFNGDLSVLRNFTNLTCLTLGNTLEGRMDFSPLEALVNLEHLRLWVAIQLSDLSIIGGLTNLTELTIHAANIRDLTPLNNLTNLTYLDLQGNRIREISDLNPHSFPNLTILRLRDNQIIDISPLKNFTNLTILGLGSNQITDASPLKSLTNLMDIDLAGNPIPQGDIDELAAALPNTGIWWDWALINAPN